jgi:hypothetical protein
MSFKSFQTNGFRLTEQDVQNMAPLIADQYQEAIKVINADLKAVYVDILSGVKPEDYYNTMLKYDRLNKLLDSVTKQYSAFSRKAGGLIAQSSKISMSNNFYRMQYTHTWLVPGIDFAVLPAELLELSVYGTTESWKRYQSSIYTRIYGPASKYYPQAGTLSEFLAANRTKEIANIQRAISQGLLRGQSYTKTAASIKDVIGQFIKKDGKIHTTGAMANAQRIVRTESTRIMNEASHANTEYARSEGVDIVRFWNATLDSRTRPVHGHLDNKPENSEGLFPGGVAGPGQFSTVGQNVHCRCTTFESVNGSKPTIRRGINTSKYDAEYNKGIANGLSVKKAEAKAKAASVEVFEYKDFDTWAKENNLKKNKYGEILSKD